MKDLREQARQGSIESDLQEMDGQAEEVLEDLSGIRAELAGLPELLSADPRSTGQGEKSDGGDRECICGCVRPCDPRRASVSRCCGMPNAQALYV